jgi:hypothetical protein
MEGLSVGWLCDTVVVLRAVVALRLGGLPPQDVEGNISTAARTGLVVTLPLVVLLRGGILCKDRYEGRQSASNHLSDHILAGHREQGFRTDALPTSARDLPSDQAR